MPEYNQQEQPVEEAQVPVASAEQNDEIANLVAEQEADVANEEAPDLSEDEGVAVS